MGTAVLPLRTVTRRPVPLRPAIAPLAPRAAGAVRTLALRTAVLPLRTITGRSLTLRTAVLPLRTITGRSLTLGTALLPATARGAGPLRAALLPVAATRPGST